MDFMLESLTDLKQLDSFDPPRVLNTHLPYRWLPRNHIANGGRIVHVIRNPKDICVSLYEFMKSVQDFGINTDTMTFEQYLNNLVFSGGK